MDKLYFKNAVLSLLLIVGGSVFAAEHDSHFLEMMSSHHKDAIEMAKMARDKAVTPAVKELAAKIESDQKKEFSLMQNWKKQWYAGEKSEHQIKPMDMSSLKRATGKEFDQAFLDLMSEHHRQGVSMTQKVQTDLERKEVRDLASKIVEKQEDEIKDMQELKSKL